MWPGDDSVPSVSQLHVPQCPPYIQQGPKEQPRKMVSVTKSLSLVSLISRNKMLVAPAQNRVAMGMK